MADRGCDFLTFEKEVGKYDARRMDASCTTSFIQKDRKLPIVSPVYNTRCSLSHAKAWAGVTFPHFFSLSLMSCK